MPRKCVIVWFPHGVDTYVIASLNCGFDKIFCALFRRCLARLIIPWKSNSRLRKIADKNVIICALCFIQVVVYSMRNPVVYVTAKKKCFANYLSCYVSLNQALFRRAVHSTENFPSWNDTGLKPREVRWRNKCSKICVILNLDSLECF